MYNTQITKIERICTDFDYTIARLRDCTLCIVLKKADRFNNNPDIYL